MISVYTAPYFRDFGFSTRSYVDTFVTKTNLLFSIENIATGCSMTTKIPVNRKKDRIVWDIINLRDDRLNYVPYEDELCQMSEMTFITRSISEILDNTEDHANLSVLRFILEIK